MKIELYAKLKQVKIFLFDLDGVLFNEGVNEQIFLHSIEAASNEFKNQNLIFGIITARIEDDLVCKLKNIAGCLIFPSSLDKVSKTAEFLNTQRVDFKNVFYMGDDLLDIPLLKKCGISAAPSNSRREVKRIVNFTIRANDCGEIFSEIFALYKKSKEMVSRATKY
jgi:3-deoxy-D-manno-octulosonate 8-phosphate phosphatase (KDO 8-P phosphatase)